MIISCIEENIMTYAKKKERKKKKRERCIRVIDTY